MALVCCSPNSREIVKLKAELIALHDEVMPLMSPLYKMRKQLQEMETDSSNAKLIFAINEIVMAEESMMDWMRNYDPDHQGSENEMIKYLSDKKLAIEQVSTQMKKSLTRGELFFAEKGGLISDL